jgi:DNA-binding transcriptional regulator YbjK
MASRVPRQDRGETRRAALVAAAVAVLSEHGPAGFSARAVATQANLPLGAVSYYFPVLDDLLGEALAAVLAGWLEHGESVARTTKGRGIAQAATAIAAAVLPSDNPPDIHHRYEHLLAAGRNQVAAAAMAALRPELKRLIARILISTRVSTSLTPDALLALVDGAALGAIAEGSADPAGRVRTTLREAMPAKATGTGGPAVRQEIQSANDRPEIRS